MSKYSKYLLLTPPLRRTGILLLAIIGIAAGIRLANLDRFSLWYDEFGSIYYVKASLGWIWGAGAMQEVNPPLYYTVLKLWISLFGTGQVAVRMLSAVLAIATVPILYRAGQLVGGPRAGLLAALLFATASVQVDYALDVRCYSLLQALAAIALLHLIRFLRDAGTAATETPGQILARRWPLILSCAAAIYTHNSALFLVAAMSATVIFRMAAAVAGGQLAARALAGLCRSWALITGAVLILAAPQLLIAFSQSSSGALDWIPALSAGHVLSVIRTLLLGGSVPYGAPSARLLLAVLAGILAWSVWQVRRDRLALAVGVVLPACGLGLLLAVSLWRPILLPRTALWTTMATYILIGAGFARLRRKLPQLALVGGLLAVQGVTLGWFLKDGEHEPWRALVAVIAAQQRPNDLFVSIDARTNCALVYYGDGRIPADGFRVFQGSPGLPSIPLEPVSLGCDRAPLIDIAQIRTALSGGARLWCLTRGQRTVEALDAPRNRLAAETTTALWQQVNPTLILARLDPK